MWEYMLLVVSLKLKEIQINGNFFRRLALICSRTPHGVRGLKFFRPYRYIVTHTMSHSAWSAWIEIESTIKRRHKKIVALRMECVD